MPISVGARDRTRAQSAFHFEGSHVVALTPVQERGLPCKQRSVTRFDKSQRKSMRNRS